MVVEGEIQIDREGAYSDRVEYAMLRTLPEVMASPGEYDIDVDLLDSGAFLNFLKLAFASGASTTRIKDGRAVEFALAALYRDYKELCEKAAEKAAQDEIAAEDESRGYNG
jgi:hypothetical protein